MTHIPPRTARGRATWRPPALAYAGALVAELERLGLTAVINGDGRVACLSIWRGLVVWVGFVGGAWWYWWTTDRRNLITGRPVIAYSTCRNPSMAARRVSYRYLTAVRANPDGGDLAIKEWP